MRFLNALPPPIPSPRPPDILDCSLKAYGGSREVLVGISDSGSHFYPICRRVKRLSCRYIFSSGKIFRSHKLQMKSLVNKNI